LINMKAALLKGPYDIEIIDVEKPEPKPGEVLIRVARCGICGSDLHAYKGKHPDFAIPLIPGHEFSGVVEDVGESVEEVKKGDRVTVEPLKICGKCYYCKRGEYNQCLKFGVLGAQTNGAFTEYIAVQERWVYKIPDKMSFEEGAMVEPTAVAVHAVRRAGIVGDTVLVLGAGTIGLLIMQVAKALGADTVVITDIVDWKLDFAKKLGADYALNPTRDNLKDVINGITDGLGVDTSFEAVGSNVTLSQALENTRKGGRVVIVGVYEKPMVEINAMKIVNKELEVFGSIVYRWDYPKAIKLIEQGRVNAKSLVSDVIPLEKIKEGFERMLRREEGIIKIQVGFNV